jgi:membrane protease YdiL (CAAX protease family)
LRQWPLFIKNAEKFDKQGPLGPHYAKVCEVVGASLLWKIQQAIIYDTDDSAFPIVLIGTNDSNVWLGVAVVLVLSVATCVVMEIWSRFRTHSHKGVQSMVDTSVGRTLSLKEHLHLLSLAAINATCEETSSRGFWKHEYQKYTKNANMLQALVFGLWHYHGIPSGWTGVGLTFVYGYIMGLLQDYFGGLVLPIFAHTLADYYIFSVIARQDKQQQIKLQ